DTALNQNGLAAIRNGRKVTIVNRDEAKTQNVPVIKESDPDKIPLTDRIVTYIIPARFVEAGQLIKDIQSLVSMQTTMTANQGANTAGNNTQSQRIKKRNRVIAVADQRTTSVVVSASRDLMGEIEAVVNTIDEKIKGVQIVQAFGIPYADPEEVRQVLVDLF